MYIYRFVIFLAVALLVAGVAFAAFSSKQPTPAQDMKQEEMRTQVVSPESAQDAALSRWAAEQGLEFVPAPRRHDEVLLTGNTIVMGEDVHGDSDPSDLRGSQVIRGNQGKAVTIEADREGGAPKIIYETKRELHISRLKDLLNIRSDEDLEKLRKGEVDVDIYRLRDDINGGLAGLGRQIRQLDQTYVIPGVSGSTSSTGGMTWATKDQQQNAREQRLRREAEARKRAAARRQQQRPGVILLP